jgi:hypothetical protein
MSGVGVPRRQFLKLAGGAGAAVVAASASGTLLSSCTSASSSDDALQIGVILPMTGSGTSIGQVSFDALNSSVSQINSTGGASGRKIKLVFADTGSEPAAAAGVYAKMAAQKGILGILWCGAPGLDTVQARISSDGIPVVVAYADPLSQGTLFPAPGAPRSMFQVSVGDIQVKTVLSNYARQDRGYNSSAFIYDRELDAYGNTRHNFEQAFGGAGLTVKGVETFAAGDTDMGGQIASLQSGAPQVVYIDGYADDAATVVMGLADKNASYIDTPTAKGPDWHPHVFGSLRDINKFWADTAGEAAVVGSASAWPLGGLPFLPSYNIGKWLKKYTGKTAQGGEEAPADGLATLLEGMKKAGSSDRAKVVAGIESMGKIMFATIPFGYGSDRHNAIVPEDVTVMTLERLRGPTPTDPPYDLGREWQTGGAYANAGAAGTLLVRPTLDANKSVHPDIMGQVMQEGFGTQCTKAADGTLSKACKIH